VRGIPVLPTILHRLAIITGQVCIGDHVVMRPGVYIPHGQVVIDGITFVDCRVVIRPFVTLGLRDGNVVGPHLESRVSIGTGAKVFGPVRVGSGAKIGANAVVNCDVPAGAVAVGAPARVV
jgi:serine O-acetyltransferase